MAILSKIKLQVEQKLPFVLYVLPNQNKLYGLFQKDNTIIDYKGQSGFVFVSFDGTKKYVIPFEGSDFLEEEFSFDTVNQTEDFASFSEREKNILKIVFKKQYYPFIMAILKKLSFHEKLKLKKD
ncbi:hypothetical protein H9X57_03150 [Flavobacterium piscinae]|uniref:hypothetical protein n=1 Tax=Flavobacterium piscinae TaxID=2506424 RepID=UPI0019B57B6C|nr:hypothetical protein [Flavobacterium piscinae]MBC8882745.1 hypothetical protein [Flavobacterium piscinae]